MGFSSFILSDTGESLANKFSSKETVEAKMIDHLGNEYFERDYEGYAKFGGVTFHELAKEMNPEFPEGTDLEEEEGAKLPKIVTIDCNERWEDLPKSEWCPFQGYFYGNCIEI